MSVSNEYESQPISLERFNYIKYDPQEGRGEMCLICKYHVSREGLINHKTQDVFHKKCIEYCEQENIDNLNSKKLHDQAIPMYCDFTKSLNLQTPPAPQQPQESLISRIVRFFICHSS